MFFPENEIFNCVGEKLRIPKGEPYDFTIAKQL